MKKMNNKGFAVSTLLYGLVLMLILIVVALMSILGSTRKNTRSLAKVIEDELNRYGTVNQTMVYDANIDTGEGRKYYTMESGWYKLELWNHRDDKINYDRTWTIDEYGSYNTGLIYLEAGQLLYIFLKEINQNKAARDERSYITIEDSDEDYTIMKALGHIYTNFDDGTYWTSNEYDYEIYGYAGGHILNPANKIELDESNNQPIIYDGMIVPEVNDGPSKFKITKISSNDRSTPPFTRINHQLDKVKYIKDCIQGSNKSEANAWQEIQAMYNGENVALNKDISISLDDEEKFQNKENIINGEFELKSDSKLAGTRQKFLNEDHDFPVCVTVDLDNEYNLDELAVWHYMEYTKGPEKDQLANSENRRYYNHEIYVADENGNFTKIRDTVNSSFTVNGQTVKNDTTEAENILGIRYSAYQLGNKNTMQPDSGKYYIFYAGDNQKNTVITVNSSKQLSLQKFTGEENQKWKITKNAYNTSMIGYPYTLQNSRENCMLARNSQTVVCATDSQNFALQWKLSSSTLQDNSYISTISLSRDMIMKNTSYLSDETLRFNFVRAH